VTAEQGAALFVVVSFAAMAALERLRPYDKGQRFLRDGFWTDALGYGIAQSYLCALLIGWLIRSMDSATGMSRLRLLAGWPVVLQVAFFVLTHDFYIYWFHRFQHRSATLWRLHEAHHSVTALDGVASLRSHALEILINQTIEFAPMVLLGASPEVPVLKSAVSAVWGVYIHANIDVHTGRLQWLLNGPEAHRWHHALDPDARDRNFATKLALWDRLFGTAWIPEGRKPAAYGLADEVFPHGYLRQQAFAFRPDARHRERGEGVAGSASSAAPPSLG
jgi:sterol desaturase/sphingolipid hydroxylase (fatty acid hydroxylase superfamily)